MWDGLSGEIDVYSISYNGMYCMWYISGCMIEHSILHIISIVYGYHGRGEICPCRHCRRQCKFVASDVYFSRNNAFYNINESTRKGSVEDRLSRWNAWEL